MFVSASTSAMFANTCTFVYTHTLFHALHDFYIILMTYRCLLFL